MVSDGFAVGDAKAAPAFALRSFEASEGVKERDGTERVGFWLGVGRQNGDGGLQ